MLKNPEIEKNVAALMKDKLQEPHDGKKCIKCSGNMENIESDIYSRAEQVVSSITAEWNQQCQKLCSEVSSLQQINDSLQTENAKMQVDIAMLTSQVNSLSTQQTALQLANSQLVAEKEEVFI